MPTPIIPEIDGLHYDWTLLGKTIQAKVATKRALCWEINHVECLGAHGDCAVSFGAYDALWLHCGPDKFALLPSSILRRHSTFRGQGISGKGRTNLCFYHGFSPKQVKTCLWKELCESYVCSWGEADLKGKVEGILASI
jgi:hypothetical protein